MRIFRARKRAGGFEVQPRQARAGMSGMGWTVDGQLSNRGEASGRCGMSYELC